MVRVNLVWMGPGSNQVRDCESGGMGRNEVDSHFEKWCEWVACWRRMLRIKPRSNGAFLYIIGIAPLSTRLNAPKKWFMVTWRSGSRNGNFYCVVQKFELKLKMDSRRIVIPERAVKFNIGPVYYSQVRQCKSCGTMTVPHITKIIQCGFFRRSSKHSSLPTCSCAASQNMIIGSSEPND